LSVGVIEFVVMRVWFVIKWGGGGVLLLFIEKNKGRRRNKGGGDGGCLSHNLNITDDYTYEYYRWVLYIGKD